MPTPSFTAPIDRTLVHRSAIAEVFITDIIDVAENQFVVGAQWPRRHSFYRTSGTDSALVAETLRQLTIALAHTRYGVSLTDSFILPSMLVNTTLQESGDAVGNVHVEVTVSGVKATAAGVARNLNVHAQFRRGDQTIATADAGAHVVNPRVYKKLRGVDALTPVDVPMPTVAPAIVGHISAENVVIGRCNDERGTLPGDRPLMVNAEHPVFFDHPLDHAPGALLIEAARQRVRIHAGKPSLDFEEFNAVFDKIVDYSPAIVRLSDTTHAFGWSFATVEVLQHGRVAATVDARF